MNWETLLCLGDSITIGARSYLGFPEYAADLLANKLDKEWKAVNHATSGFTAIDLARSMQQQFLNLKSHEPGFITVLIGTNDVKLGTDISDYAIALRQIVVMTRQLAGPNQIALIEIPTFPPGVMYPYLVSMNETVGRFNEVIRATAQKSGVRSFSLSLEADHLFDGVHLNRFGCQACATKIADFILNDRGLG